MPNGSFSQRPRVVSVDLTALRMVQVDGLRVLPIRVLLRLDQLSLRCQEETPVFKCDRENLVADPFSLLFQIVDLSLVF